MVYELECRKKRKNTTSPLHEREKETLRIELTKNGVRERKREQEKSKRKDKEATDYNQCSIERTKSFSETETKKSRQEATGNWQLPAEVGAPHKVLETVFQDLDTRPSWIESNVFALDVGNTTLGWMNIGNRSTTNMPKAGSKFKARYVRSRPRQDEPLRWVESCSKLNCR